MKRIAAGLVAAAAAIAAAAALSAQQPPQVIPHDPDWAFQIQQMQLPPEPAAPKKLEGSARSYTPKEIDDLASPPDWYPEEHRPAPAAVVKGHGDALACGACHLMNGMGHPESASVGGFTARYIQQQMADFKSGVRKDLAGRMNTIANALTDQEIHDAAEWFASLEPRPWTTVREAAMVPKTVIANGRMRFVAPGGGMEPIGRRIITVPEDAERARARDPHSGFIAYVPPGSIARGRRLAETGGNGRTIACTTCHGDGLRGLGNVPRLAGLHPIYVVRQLYLFKDGTRHGVDGELMKKPLAKLTGDDILALAAYIGSLPPVAADGAATR
jgi:cytochrome c553